MSKWPPSVFDVLGPIMVGPSSSHTGGAWAMGRAARGALGAEPRRASIRLLGSYGKTYRGHATDKAVVAGLLGLLAADRRIPEALELARERGLEITLTVGSEEPEHPNTCEMRLEGDEASVGLRCVSIGGGAIEVRAVDSCPVEIAPDSSAILVWTVKGDHGRAQAMLSASGLRVSAVHPGLVMGVGPGEMPPDLARRARSVWPQVGVIASSRRPPLRGHLPTSLLGLAQRAESAGVSLGEAVLGYEAEGSGASREAVREEMRRVLEIMRTALARGLSGELNTIGGLVSGDGRRLASATREGKLRVGGRDLELMAKTLAYALAIQEHNAAMGVIVPAPTGGACGTVPGALLALAEHMGLDEEACLRGLFAAGGFGAQVMLVSSVSAAVAGCQVECGVASAMAAAGLVDLAGGSPREAIHAGALALKNHLGLACDAVAGLVEVPCVKRNGVSAVVALGCAQMATAGVRSVIPPDEVVWALADIGRCLPPELRDTCGAGLALTPTGREVMYRVFGEHLADRG